jgi:5,10-methylenetetrahydromethanopterin reductase
LTSAVEISRFVFPEGTLDEFVAAIAECEPQGFHAVWVPQIFGWDPLTALAIAGTRTTRLRLGTAVVPSYPTHPLALAATAMTAQAATGGRLALGLGASHRFLVEQSWGMSYARPAARMRDYLAALVPAMAGEPVAVHTERLTARTPRPLELPGVTPPAVLLAAMGERMLAVAGEAASGTVTWLAGTRVIAGHIVPTLRAAAERAGRDAPAVVVALPVCITSNPAAARALAAERYAPYTDVPSYRAVLDREDAATPADVALIGSAEQVAEQLDELNAAGATEFCADVFGNTDERAGTVEFLRHYRTERRQRG